VLEWYGNGDSNNRDTDDSHFIDILSSVEPSSSSSSSSVTVDHENHARWQGKALTEGLLGFSSSQILKPAP
jgi:hypothetical protein